MQMMERAHLPNLKGFVSYVHICLTRFVFSFHAMRICGQKELQQAFKSTANGKLSKYYIAGFKNSSLKGQSINADVLKDKGFLSLAGNEEENVPINFHFVFSPVGNL